MSEIVAGAQAQISGLYTPVDSAANKGAVLRLDLDGPKPQNAASGMLDGQEWAASLLTVEPGHWKGAIWFHPPQFSYLSLEVRKTNQPEVVSVLFYGPRNATRTVLFRRVSPFFRYANVEFDWIEGAKPQLEFDRSAHSNRPTDLPSGKITLQEVFRQSGIDLKVKLGSEIALPPGTANHKWTCAELHDAMQHNWELANQGAIGALWALMAGLSADGEAICGLMFDSASDKQRQGVAIFNQALARAVPKGETQAGAWAARMEFHTICHEIGHAFNLVHSFEQGFYGNAWKAIDNRNGSYSLMNYPKSVPGGESAYFKGCHFDFDPEELTFLRHAPDRLVVMGCAPFLGNLVEKWAAPANQGLELTLRTTQDAPAFELLEPVMLEAKLTNRSGQDLFIDKNALVGCGLSLLVQGAYDEARVVQPYARPCMAPVSTLLMNGKSLFAPVYASSGVGGWHIDRPGTYWITARLLLGNDYIYSSAIEIQVAEPGDVEREIATRFFTDGVGRALFFDGSLILAESNQVLAEVVEKLPNSKARIHAQIALQAPHTYPFKSVSFQSDTGGKPVPNLEVHTPADAGVAFGKIVEVLRSKPMVAASTLGPIEYKQYVDMATDYAESMKEIELARTMQQAMLEAFTVRNIAPAVLDQVRRRVIKLDSA